MSEKNEGRQEGVNISGSNIHIKGDVVGRDKITKNTFESASLANQFKEIHRLIHERPNDPSVDKNELIEVVSKIEQEVQKGQAGNEKKVERWLRFLSSMADDIFDVTVNALSSPVLGVAKAFQLIAKKARSAN